MLAMAHSLTRLRLRPMRRSTVETAGAATEIDRGRDLRARDMAADGLHPQRHDVGRKALRLVMAKVDVAVGVFEGIHRPASSTTRYRDGLRSEMALSFPPDLGGDFSPDFPPDEVAVLEVDASEPPRHAGLVGGIRECCP